MKWIDRYVQAVGQWLPATERQEICEELTANLRDQLDDHATDERALVADLGHPALWAARLHPRQALISQPLLALYQRALYWQLALVAGLHLFLSVPAWVSQGEYNPLRLLLQAAGGTLDSFVWLFAVTTGIFYLLEQQLSRLSLFSRWQPDSLPALQPVWLTISRTDAVAGLVANCLFAGLLLEWWSIAALEELQPSTSNHWQRLLPAIVSLSLGWALLHLYHCFVPRWQRAGLVTALLLNGTTLVLVVVLARDPQPWLQFAQGSPVLNRIAEINQYALLTSVACLCVYELIRDGRRLQKFTKFIAT